MTVRARRPLRGAGVAGVAVVAAVLLGGCSDDGAVATPSVGAGASTPATGAGPDPSSVPSTTGPEPTAGASAGASADPTATSAAPTVPQTPVAPPGGEGDLEPVPTTAVVTLPPVPLGTPAALAASVEVRVVDVEAVEVTGRGPGQMSGPAVAVTVEVANDGPVDLAVAGVAVSLAYAGSEAPPVDGPPADPVVGPVPAGTDVRGTYVFIVPEDERDGLTVRVGLASQPVVVFTGRATT